jgi:hypothetical protein
MIVIVFMGDRTLEDLVGAAPTAHKRFSTFNPFVESAGVRPEIYQNLRCGAQT